MPQKIPEIVAAVDLGSNSFHMIVCSLKDGKMHIIDRIKEMVRLASGLDKKNHLDLITQKRALECLERFGQRIGNLPSESVRCVGTSTLRNATNSRQFILKAERALGHPIHVISGVEEARLIYQGVAYSLSSSATKRFVMDIGGGSTEYIIGTDDKPRIKESLNMGCVSVSNLFFPDGKLSAQAVDDALLFAQQKLDPHQKNYNHKNWDEAIGASGSLRAIQKVLEATGWSNNGITLEGLDKLMERIKSVKHINDLNLPELDPERLPVFPGGAVIVAATFKALGIEQMTVSDGALREGLVYDLLGRIYNRDIRSETVQMLSDRYHTDQAHADRIKKTLHTMLKQIELFSDDDNKENGINFLDWAADLHEMGRDIAHSQYHKHGAYIIANADLAGFSKQDQAIVSVLIKSHRRKFSMKRFEGLSEPWQQYAPFMTILLRLAILLHRNRNDIELPEFSITIVKSKLKLTFPEGWLDQSPLTRADLNKEADYLKAAGFKLSCF
ncbi:exopolyphosphatase [Methylotuvimicrobium alcaliphilum]|uniref:Exopolyphosphatase n=1 Tax=Methylotuvimicrobium alcaliphilum (strain DSM 19304 / NCIMB 14124 / VKM B-2133 / 20Z) TaxID=1091494 RepID=G4SY47_META2|nr:exopolyphosphatase [Methylotuvimicrobium alcaliphilum]CCE24344.1 Exopolyphosphatase [Methylotuvimicrobium alcaliphilum 20Z]